MMLYSADRFLTFTASALVPLQTVCMATQPDPTRFVARLITISRGRRQNLCTSQSTLQCECCSMLTDGETESQQNAAWFWDASSETLMLHMCPPAVSETGAVLEGTCCPHVALAHEGKQVLCQHGWGPAGREQPSICMCRSGDAAVPLTPWAVDVCCSLQLVVDPPSVFKPAVVSPDTHTFHVGTFLWQGVRAGGNGRKDAWGFIQGTLCIKDMNALPSSKETVTAQVQFGDEQRCTEFSNVYRPKPIDLRIDFYMTCLKSRTHNILKWQMCYSVFILFTWLGKWPILLFIATICWSNSFQRNQPRHRLFKCFFFFFSFVLFWF